MKYFIDTHDKTKGSYPQQELTEEEWLEAYKAFEEACENEGGLALGAHVNLKDGRAFCFTAGKDAEAIRRAHEAVDMPFDSITEVKRISGLDLRPSEQTDTNCASSSDACEK
ncbi:MAG: DUF4242 domain-containing protein [Phycisphaerales bacterium]|nr:DUF4242 domain-containing protein [Phycisphaerales bacterium]